MGRRIQGSGHLSHSSLPAIFFAPTLPPPQTNTQAGGGALSPSAQLPLHPRRRTAPVHMCDSCFGFHWRQTGAGAFPSRRNSLRVAHNNTNTSGPCSVLRCPQCARHQAGFIARSPDCKRSFMSPHNATTERH